MALNNKIEKVRKNNEFRIIYRKGKSFSNRLLVLYVMKNSSTVNRVGISVSKKVGESVVRSRVKRLINEGYRLNKGNLKKGYDLVFIARNTSKDKNYFEIQAAVINLLMKAGIFNNEENFD